MKDLISGKNYAFDTEIGRIVLLLFAGILFFTAPGLATAADAPVYKLDDIVVSTTRNEIPVSNAAQSVTVISEDDIMSSPFERVEDIIRSAPGVYNTRHFGTQRSGVSNPITIRGAGGNRVLMLVDGVPQNANFNNSIAWVAWGHIPKEAIARIEIVRGPTSAMYGSEGIGGVIHIITKQPQKQRQTSVRAEAGTSDTYAGHGFFSQRFDDFGMLAAGGYEESDGFYMTQDPEPYEIKRHREIGKVFGKASYDLDDMSRLDFSALYYDHETGKGRKFFYDELRLGQYALNYTRQAGSGADIKGLLYYNRADKTAFQDSAKDDFASLFRREESPSTTWGADLQTTLPVADPATLTIGAAFKESSWDYDNEYVNSNRDEGAEGTQRYLSPFANMDLEFFKQRLLVNLGARYDWIRTSDGANWDDDPDAGDPYHNTYGSEENSSFSPKIGITWHPDEKTTLRASAGKGFRAPSLFELYKVHVRQGGKYFRHANPDLEPEKIWSYDVGVDRSITNRLQGSLTYYQSYAEDYIGTRVTNTYEQGGQTYKEYILDNISEVDIHGIEAELNWYPRMDLDLFVNYTWNVSAIEENQADPFEQGQYLTNDPRHKFHAGAIYRNPRIVNVTVVWNRYIDKYYDVDETTQDKDSFWSVDLRVSRRFFAGLSAYLNIENVFDSVDNEAIAPGAIYTGGVKFEF
ncbi:MAG: TonB-dependent receptor [Desulfobacterales bacterium]|nr:TonB-dependent receptor [Desulfobacterales bacterium]